METTFREEFRLKMFQLDHKKAGDFANSPWMPWVILAAIRIVIALYCISLWIAICSMGGCSGRMFRFLTQEGFLFLTISYTVSSLVTLWHNVKEKKITTIQVDTQMQSSEELPLLEGTNHEDLDEPPAKWHHKAMWLIQGTITSVATMIVIVFWSIMGSHSRGFDEILNLTTHGFNMGFLLLDLLISSFPIRLLHVVYPMVFILCYFIMSVIYFYKTGDGLYGILIYKQEHAGKVTGMWLACLFVLLPIIQLILYGLYRLRLYAVKKLKQ